MVLTPLGILAAGTAWGEWSARDFSNLQAREKMAVASHNTAPPPIHQGACSAFPRCVDRAPFPQYAPSFDAPPVGGLCAPHAMFVVPAPHLGRAGCGGHG